MPKVRWTNSRSGAKKRDLEWAIDYEDYVALIVQVCFYCQGALDECGAGLDRKDNDLGYMVDNVVPCCSLCNYMKSDMLSYEQMVRLSPVLQELRREGNLGTGKLLHQTGNEKLKSTFV